MNPAFQTDDKGPWSFRRLGCGIGEGSRDEPGCCRKGESYRICVTCGRPGRGRGGHLQVRMMLWPLLPDGVQVARKDLMCECDQRPSDTDSGHRQVAPGAGRFAGGKPVIGLLGGPGAGKSTVAAAFAKHGAGVIDADAIAHAVLQAQDVREQLRAWWGQSVWAEGEQVDRSAVGRIVFGNPQAMARLEGLVHPRVAAERARQREVFFADPACRAVIEDVPLLLEKGLERGCDVLVFIEVDRAERLRRVKETRDWTDAELERREKMQLPLDTKRQRADYVLTNSGDRQALDNQVGCLLSRILSP